MAQDAELSWGYLQFHGPLPAETDYAFQAMADGSNLGNPEPLWEIAKSLLTDGSLAVLQGWDNREASIRLRLSAPNGIAGPALAAAEAALMLALQAKSLAPLRTVPPAQDAVASFFDVVAARLDRDNSDGWGAEESRREYRYYLLTLTCLPFARRENTVIVPALAPAPPVPTTVDIDDCASATGWAIHPVDGAQNLTMYASGGAVVLDASAKSVSGPGIPRICLRRNGSVSLGATPYVRVSVSMTGGLNALIGVNLTGSTWVGPLVAAAPSAIPGATDYYFKPATGTVSHLAFRAASSVPLPGGTPVSLRIHHIARTDTLPTTGSPHQQTRLATVGGSAPTQASIRLYDALGAALGSEIMAYTSQNVRWRPSLRPWVVSSSPVTFTQARVSGGFNTLAAPMVFEFPASLLDEGAYALSALLNVTVAGEVGWSVRIVNSSGAATIGSSVVLSGTTPVGVTGGAYKVFTLASLLLPVVAVEGDQLIELTLTGTANMIVDEAMLFDLTNGGLTWLRDSDLMRWIDIRSPELGAERPHVFGGLGAFGTNPACVDWKCESFGTHRFKPGPILVWTMTPTALKAQSELEFYERSHTHVEDDAA